MCVSVCVQVSIATTLLAVFILVLRYQVFLSRRVLFLIVPVYPVRTILW